MITWNLKIICYYTEAITKKSIKYLNEHDPLNPFFLYVAYTAPHFPLHAREESIAKYRGAYSKGYEKIRKERYDRLVEMGIIDADWDLTPRDAKAPAWENLEDKEWEQSRMEAFAGMVDHVDQGIGKIVASLGELGFLENTLIFFLSDNGGEALEHSGRKNWRERITLGDYEICSA